MLTLLALVLGGVVLLLLAVVMVFVVLLLEGGVRPLPAVLGLFAVVLLGLGGADLRLPAAGALVGTVLAGATLVRTFFSELLCCSSEVSLGTGASDLKAFLRRFRSGLDGSAV